jgi:hypothetical protein
MVSVARLCTLEFSTPAGELTLRLCSATLAWESAGGLAGFQPGPSTGSSGSSRKPGGESECDPNAISGVELRAGGKIESHIPEGGWTLFRRPMWSRLSVNPTVAWV